MDIDAGKMIKAYLVNQILCLKIAIFCDRDFWHSKNWEIKMHEHKSNIEFWHKKIQRNIDKDREVTQYL